MDDDDGGMQWWAEVGQREQEEHWADRDARLLEEHRQWVKKFHEDEKREKEQAHEMD